MYSQDFLSADSVQTTEFYPNDKKIYIVIKTEISICMKYELEITFLEVQINILTAKSKIQMSKVSLEVPFSSYVTGILIS